MKTLEKYLTVWIFACMALGILLGNLFTDIPVLIEKVTYDGVNIPIAIGLILMMYPPLAKVNYGQLPKVFRDTKTLSLSLVYNWVLGPVLMFVLAIVFLADEPGYFSGLILIGLARCIAMVLVWNDLAKGDREYAAGLVALNSLFQVFTYSIYAWVFIYKVPAWLGYQSLEVEIPFSQIVESVLVYLGIPFLMGMVTRWGLIRYKGEQVYQQFVTKISPMTLFALLFTIVLMFSLKGQLITTLYLDVIKVAIPLLIYFVLMFVLSYFISYWRGVEHAKNVSISFTASGNNFELAIAVSVAVFGLNSDQAFVGVIGPLIEVPVLILLVKFAYYLKRKLAV